MATQFCSKEYTDIIISFLLTRDSKTEMGTSTLTSQSETWWLKVAPVEFTWLYREPTTRPGLGLHVYSAPCSGTYLQLNSHSRKQAGVINLRFEEIQS